MIGKDLKKICLNPDIPSPFKRVLFWPERKPSTSKRIRKEKLPAVLTSPQAIRFYHKKEEIKQHKAEEIAKRNKARIQKQKELQEREKVGEELRKKRKEETKRKRQDTIDSTTSESLSMESSDSSPWDEDFEDATPADDLPFENVNYTLLSEGDFVLCEFVGGKRNQNSYMFV